MKKDLGNPCQLTDQVNAIVLNFSDSNQVLANSLYQQLLTAVQSLMIQGFKNTMKNQTSLFTSFQNNDPNSYFLLQALISNNQSLNENCSSSEMAFRTFFSSLNSNGQKDMRKIGCYVMLYFRKNIPSLMGQFFVKNADDLIIIKNSEGRHFDNLIKLFQEIFFHMKN